MKHRQTLLILCLLLTACVALPGCFSFKGDVGVPEGYGMAPTPTSSIPQANPNDKADLIRENQQLRERVAWLDNENRKDAGRYAKKENEVAEIQADMARIAAERDQYLRGGR